jgi:hypothetical protein
MQAEARVIQAEVNIAQAEARVLLQWNELRAILAKPPAERHAGELECAQAALKFAESAHERAVTAYSAAELAQAKISAVSATVDPASAASSSSSARQRSPPSRENASAPDDVCTTRHPLAAATKRRASKDALNNRGNLDDAIEESEPSSKKSKFSSASSSSSCQSCPSSSSASLSSSSSSSLQASVEPKASAASSKIPQAELSNEVRSLETPRLFYESLVRLIMYL